MLVDPDNLIDPAQEIQSEGDTTSMAYSYQADQSKIATALSGSHTLLTNGVTCVESPFTLFPIGAEMMGNKITPVSIPMNCTNTRTPVESRSAVSSVRPRRLLLTGSRGERKYQCQFLNTLACLLSRPKMQKYATKLTAVDKLIGVFKAVAKEISSVTKCRRCNTRVEVMAVAASVTQNLVTLFEHMVNGLLASNPEHVNLWVESVRIDDDAERNLLCQTVVCLQFWHVDRLLETLGCLAESSPANVRMFNSQVATIASIKQRLENDLKVSENDE